MSLVAMELFVSVITVARNDSVSRCPTRLSVVPAHWREPSAASGNWDASSGLSVPKTTLQSICATRRQRQRQFPWLQESEEKLTLGGMGAARAMQENTGPSND